MDVSAARRAQRTLRLAFAFSLLLHAVILLAPLHAPRKAAPAKLRLQTRLAPKAVEAPPQVVQTPEPVAPPTRAAAPRKRVLTRAPDSRPSPASVPQFSEAERSEMKGFLDDLDKAARQQPSLAQRALAMARDIGRQTASEPDEGAVSLERIPDSPPVDPFSLEMYLDALVNKLNRSTHHVKDERKQVGYKKAAVQLRLNPDGTIRSFEVLNAGDQFDQIAFIRALVERAAPYSPFPPDIVRSAKSMAILICIIPTAGQGNLGFTRSAEGRGC